MHTRHIYLACIDLGRSRSSRRKSHEAMRNAGHSDRHKKSRHVHFVCHKYFWMEHSHLARRAYHWLKTAPRLVEHHVGCWRCMAMQLYIYMHIWIRVYISCRSHTCCYYCPDKLRAYNCRCCTDYPHHSHRHLSWLWSFDVRVARIRRPRPPNEIRTTPNKIYNGCIKLRFVVLL